MKTFRLTTVCALLAGAALLAVAAAPAARAQEDQEEVLAYAAWRAAYDAKDTAKATQLAGDYLKKYPKGKYADYLTKWVTQTTGRAPQTPLQEALEAGNTAQVVQLGKQKLQKEPNDVASFLAIAWHLRKGLDPPAEVTRFSQHAIGLVEAGKKPAGATQFDRSLTLGWLYQNLALAAAKQGKADEALKNYTKSTSAAPGDPAITTRNHRECGRIHSVKMNAAIKKQQEAAAGGAEGDALQPLIDAVNAEADATIDCWARLLGQVKAHPKYAKLGEGIRGTLEAIYASRHPDDPASLDALIASHAR